MRLFICIIIIINSFFKKLAALFRIKNLQLWNIFFYIFYVVIFGVFFYLFCENFFSVGYLIFFIVLGFIGCLLMPQFSVLFLFVFFIFFKFIIFIIRCVFGFLDIFLFLFIVLLPVGAYSVLDRKILALVQRRKGPIICGPWGMLQFICDALKLFFKEIILPGRSNSKWFFAAPVLALAFSLTGWFILPMHPSICFSNSNFDLLLLFLLSSLHAYTIIIAGWASNSRYAFFGSLRAIAQLISYEIPMLFSVLPIVAFSGSLNLRGIILFQTTHVFCFWFFFIGAVIFFICIVAETNRAPFDFAEAESELVAGYGTEYSSFIFACFFIGEYSSMLLMSGLWVDIFWGGWLPILDCFDFLPNTVNFSFKLSMLTLFFTFIRANLPRYRYDQFVSFGWKILFPVSFGQFFILLILLIKLLYF